MTQGACHPLPPCSLSSDAWPVPWAHAPVSPMFTELQSMACPLGVPVGRLTAWLPSKEAEAPTRDGPTVCPAVLATADRDWLASGTVFPVGCLWLN